MDFIGNILAPICAGISVFASFMYTIHTLQQLEVEKQNDKEAEIYYAFCKYVHS